MSQLLVPPQQQAKALRTPPPSDSFVVQCFVFTAAGVRLKPVLIRLAGSGTGEDLLRSLFEMNLLGSNNERKLDLSYFEVRPALGDGSAPNAGVKPIPLTAPLRASQTLRFPYIVAVTTKETDLELVATLRQQEAIANAREVSPDKCNIDDEEAVTVDILVGGGSLATASPQRSEIHDDTNAPKEITESMRAKERREKRQMREEEKKRIALLEQKRAITIAQLEKERKEREEQDKALALEKEKRRQLMHREDQFKILEKEMRFKERVQKLENEKLTKAESRAAKRRELEELFQQEEEKARSRVAGDTTSPLRLHCQSTRAQPEAGPLISQSDNLTREVLKGEISVPVHPMESSDALSTLLRNLDSSMEASRAEAEENVVKDRDAIRERVRQDYHGRLIEETVKFRRERKAHLKRTAAERDIALIEIQKSKEREEREKKMEKQRADEERMKAYYDKKAEEERRAEWYAEKQQEVERFGERRIEALHKPRYNMQPGDVM